MPMLALINSSCSSNWKGWLKQSSSLWATSSASLFLLQAGQQDNKFVTAKARYCVDIAQVGLEAFGDALEQLVADRMAEAVIDVLETVEVDKQHGAHALVDAGHLR